MRVTFCDACGSESSGTCRVAIACHLYSMAGNLGYVDGDMNRVSGREDVLDLCHKCYNHSVSKMVAEIRKIQQADDNRGKV